eukprot:3237102-Alexandrium_andersonii.AAC.1
MAPRLLPARGASPSLRRVPLWAVLLRPPARLALPRARSATASAGLGAAFFPSPMRRDRAAPVAS